MYSHKLTYMFNSSSVEKICHIDKLYNESLDKMFDVQAVTDGRWGQTATGAGHAGLKLAACCGSAIVRAVSRSRPHFISIGIGSQRLLITALRHSPQRRGRPADPRSVAMDSSRL